MLAAPVPWWANVRHVLPSWRRRQSSAGNEDAVTGFAYPSISHVLSSGVVQCVGRPKQEVYQVPGWLLSIRRGTGGQQSPCGQGTTTVQMERRFSAMSLLGNPKDIMDKEQQCNAVEVHA
eukprot:3736659-Amphidinium_carterae.1